MQYFKWFSFADNIYIHLSKWHNLFDTWRVYCHSSIATCNTYFQTICSFVSRCKENIEDFYLSTPFHKTPFLNCKEISLTTKNVPKAYQELCPPQTYNYNLSLACPYYGCVCSVINTTGDWVVWQVIYCTVYKTIIAHRHLHHQRISVLLMWSWLKSVQIKTCQDTPGSVKISQDNNCKSSEAMKNQVNL